MTRAAKPGEKPVRIELCRHIVADPEICHGRVTFKGTRVFVADVLEEIEAGHPWEVILARWGGGRISKDALAEAVHLARSAWLRTDGRPVSRGGKSRLQRA